MGDIKNHIKQVKQRDGKIAKFSQKKITDAIFQAAQSVGGKDKKRAKVVSEDVVKRLNEKFKENEIPEVQDIANLIEKSLIELGHAKVAKTYILYEDLKNRIRNVSHLVDVNDLVKSYLEKADWRVKEDANKDYSLHGLNYHIFSSVSANYWLNSMYPERVTKAQIDADFHIHDLGIIAAYCAGWDLKALLWNGFTGVTGKVSWPPATHFHEAISQIVAFIYTLQHEAAGAQAFSNFDTYLAPFVKYDSLDYPQVKAIMKDFLYRMNVPTRFGFQTPFSNITLDVKPTGSLANEPVIVGGKLMKETYKEFGKEQMMINRAFAEAMIEGDASGRVFTFPIPTYNITDDFDWNNEELKPMWDMAAKYGIPYFSNFINSDMDPDDVRSMCCRLRIDNRELRKKGGGLFGSNPLTGSIGVVTINMPRIGYTSKTKEEFYAKLGNIMDIAKESLMIKRQVIEELCENGLYPYSKYYLKDVKERTGKYWANHFATIGFVGMNEAAINFMHKDITSKEGYAFSIEVLDFMRERLLKYQKETNEMFNLEAPPAESAAYKLALHDKKRYPYIIVANEEEYNRGADPFYTNSTQLPVGCTQDIFQALDWQDEMQCKYTGGTVFHAYLGERLPDGAAAKKLVQKVFQNYKLPYFSITPTFSICPKHGYIDGEHEYCPKCDEEIGYVGK